MNQNIVLHGDNAKPEMFLKISPRLLEIMGVIAQFVNERCKQQLRITSIIRAPGTVVGESGIHATGRAFDFSVAGISMFDLTVLVDEINKRFIYDPARKQMKTIIVHDVGAGNHAHVQVLN